MVLKTLRDQFHLALKDDYPETERLSFFNILTQAYLKMTRIDVTLNLSQPISNAILETFEKAIEALKNHEPIQYIIGATEFCGLPIKVNEHTLIPRPETEELVQWVIDRSKYKTTPLTILDIGTGTGCIAISLAIHLPEAKVYGVDISEKALEVAETNARLNEVEVVFKTLDILHWKSEIENSGLMNVQFDLVVSNPPYVRHLEKAHMRANVLDHEPALALFVEDENPLLFYRTIAEFASCSLKSDGRLFFEINQYLGKDMVDLLRDFGFSEIELRKDIFGNDRMLLGVKNAST